MSNAREHVADEFGPVYAITLPVNFPHTGRYALFRPLGEKRFPNFEDNILISRNPGEDFEVVWSAYVPFDEEPMCLWDNVQAPEQVVLFERYYLAFSLDGGATIRKPTEFQQKTIGYGLDGRWSDTGILEAYIHENQLLVKTCQAMWDDMRDHPKSDIEVATWSIPIEEDSAPVSLGTEPLRSRWSIPVPIREEPGALLKTDGKLLWARWALEETYVPVPLVKLAQKLAKTGRVDFFGGSGARSFF